MTQATKAISLILPLTAAMMTARPSFAQPASENVVQAQKLLEEAQKLFEEALALLKADKYADACPKLQQSQKLAPAMGTKYRLAECYESIGRVGSAWSLFTEVANDAKNANRADREAQARSHADGLRARVPMMTLTVPPEVASLAGVGVTRDGESLDRGAWNREVPVDPGAHTIAATAPGRKPWQQKEVWREGQAIVVSVPPLELSAPTLSPHVTPGQTAAPPFKASSRDATRTAWGGQRIAGVAVGAAGLAGLGIGSALGVMAIQKKNASNDGHCHDGNQCDDTGIQLRRDGITVGNASTALFVVGGAAVATGVVLFVTAPKKTEPVVALGLGPVGAEVRGTW